MIRFDILYTVHALIFFLNNDVRSHTIDYSATEIIEEWGCHDTEFRLTCGHLDSTIAVLSAFFAPNCTESQTDDDCTNLDMKNLARAYTSPAAFDSRVRETQAGKTFLDILQRSHEVIELPTRTFGANNIMDVKTKRNSLRVALEHLIVEYLRELNSDEDGSYSESHRRRRSMDAITTDDKANSEFEYNATRVEIGAANISVDEISDGYGASDRMHSPTICRNRYTRVSKFYQSELDNVHINDPDNAEHNIRRILTYRCSGKNHCSFVFEVDYPFSVLWNSGIVRIKYICMRDYRLNKFCGERLMIGYGIDVRKNMSKNQVEGEPKAEARIQGEQSIHHLTILKQSMKSDVPTMNVSHTGKGPKRTSQVFSQDFRIIKILPSIPEKFKNFSKIHLKTFTNEIISDTENRNNSTLVEETTYSAVQKNDPLSKKVKPMTYETLTVTQSNMEWDTRLHQTNSTTDSIETRSSSDDLKRLSTSRFQDPKRLLWSQTPLVYGFLATTGYPKFYIGESNCSWILIAPPQQHVRLSILDMHLRYDTYCKDYLEILDPESNRVIFNGCSEYDKPFQIVSDSNRLKITVRATSKVAYPKRGVLLYYTVNGCLTLPSPLNARLIVSNHHSAKYACDPNFIFPDSAESYRELICTFQYKWDKTLPDCIERPPVAREGSATITFTYLNQNRHNHNTSDTRSDTMYDVTIPSFIIVGIFFGNSIVLLMIMRYRNKKNQYCDFEVASL